MISLNLNQYMIYRFFYDLLTSIDALFKNLVDLLPYLSSYWKQL